MQPTALPVASSTAGSVPARHGLLRVVGPDTLAQQDAAKAAQDEADNRMQQPDMSMLAGHIHRRMTEMRNFRNTEGIAQRLIDALRTYKGQYDPAKLQEIKKFNGSEVYARITATKCRGATALLRDIYLGPERPWGIEPTPEPTVPGNIDQTIQQLVSIEVATMQQAGQQIDGQMIQDRVAMLRDAAEMAAAKQADKDASKAETKMNDLLVEGKFYEAFAQFLIDLPIFPFACIKGPVVRRASQLKWVGTQPQMTYEPKMFWYRVSPFDLYWSPGASEVHEAEFIERIRLTREDLMSVRGLPGYDSGAIDQVLTRFGENGLRDWWDTTDQERARLENREQWPRANGTLIDTAEFHGSIQGATLLDWGMDEQEVTDPLQEYRIQAWMIDRYIIKVQLNPTPSQRAPFYMSNYEKVPGALMGYGLPDLLEDVQSIVNATARALVNNLGIASGPQVVVNDAVLAAGETDDLYPWKRWHVNFDPMISSASQKPIDFFQPTSNADILMTVYERWSQIGDEVSALPRYMMGNERVGGAGRTASGLSMLMGAASKTLQNVAASIDRDIFKPMLETLYDMIMLTSPGIFRGDESIAVKGVSHATKREQDRMRQLEFLQITANPIDMGIIGPQGRATVLRSVSQNLGLEHDKVIPDDATIQQQMQQQAMMAQQQAQQGAPPGQTPHPKNQRAGPEAAREQIEGQVSSRPGVPNGT